MRLVMAGLLQQEVNPGQQQEVSPGLDSGEERMQQRPPNRAMQHRKLMRKLLAACQLSIVACGR